MLIVGAGLAGLISANVFPQARIIEAASREKLEHKALLRFRSSAVADATGIEFRKVKVHKGIWHDGGFVDPNIRLANLYSKKVIGKLADRSIWNLAPSERFIAPEDFISQMIENCGNRIEWERPFELGDADEHVISTMPMPVLAKLIGEEECLPEFKSSPIGVSRFRVKGADVFQTIYFTNPETPIYRASITGELLIIEYMTEGCAEQIGEVLPVLDAFGLSMSDVEQIDSNRQKFGKIAKIDDDWRRKFIFNASAKFNIYSVGRFATWRNILLDDVVQDLNVVKRLIKVGSVYETAKRR